MSGELGDLTGPLDLTDRKVLARWLARVRGYVSALEALMRAVPPMPFINVEVYASPSHVPRVTLRSDTVPEKTLVVQLLRETKRDVVVVMNNGEERHFNRQTGRERQKRGDTRPPSGWHLVVQVKPPEADPNAPAR